MSAGVPAKTAHLYPAWNTFTNELNQLGEDMINKLPERLRDNPQIQQEVGRLLLQALASKSIDMLSSDADHPAFVPWINSTLNVFQPNADTIYKIASVNPEGSYRLRGKLGSLRLFKIGQFGSPTPEEVGAGSPVSPIAHNDFNALKTDNNGHFDVILSHARPKGYKGDWWHLEPQTVRLWVRQVAYDWASEVDPTISIERLDIPVRRPRPPAAELEKKLLGLATLTGNMAGYFIDHVETLRTEGFINTLKEFDLSELGGFAGQFYYEGSYQLTNDEALIVSAEVPSECHYWSMILTNELFETTDWYNNHSSLNGSQATIDTDHHVRVVISAKDPGVPNWLDIAGYPIGVIQGRWTDCNSSPIPTAQKVSVKDVRNFLPEETPVVTPNEREKIIRERRKQLQHRPLW